MGPIRVLSSWRRRPGASVSPEANGFFFLTDGLAGLLLGACLFTAALGLSLQAVRLYDQARQRQLAAMVCRQVMEGWKSGCPPSDRVVIQGRTYEVTHAQTALGEGYVLWQVEAGDDHGPHVSCRLLVPAGTEEKRLDPLGRTPGLEPVGPDSDGFAASGGTAGPPGLALPD
ncbi:hypothetical protein [uncultured Megasphaera sp.]|uniref:hypothetical protein n=1 Tax=uncultured Megasphaera sp. TaxID=165188 RepID=UPI0025DD2DA1|nr:hypothetical protein [uncultured Megasphaera sp.]